MIEGFILLHVCLVTSHIFSLNDKVDFVGDIVDHCSMRSRFYKYTHAQTVFTLSIVIIRAEHAQL